MTNRDDLVEEVIKELYLLRPELGVTELSGDSVLWGDSRIQGSLDLESLDILELLIMFEEDHGLRMPDDLDIVTSESVSIGGLVDLLIEFNSAE